MNIRKCNKCGIEKELTEFGKQKDCRGGYASTCKICKYNKDKERRDEIANSVKKLPENGLKICCTCKVEKDIKFFSKRITMFDGLMSRCKECVASHHQKTKEVSKIRDKKYYLKNKKEIYAYKNRWVKKRREDNFYRLKLNIRSLVKETFKHSCKGNYRKNCKTETMLGCTMEEFVKYIEKQFSYWMNWDNYGDKCEILEFDCSWDLDHIVPVSLSKTEEEIYLLNHWSNYQPLCSKINRDIKRAKLYPVCNIELNRTFNN